MMFLMSVPGGTLALLRDTPGMKKGWAGTGQGKDCKLAALAASGSAHGAPLRPPAPPCALRHPQALQWMKVMQASWRAWEVETLRCVRGLGAFRKRRGPVKVAKLHRCFALASRPPPRLHHRITPHPHPSSLPLN
jgi:hypothetical protein